MLTWERSLNGNYISPSTGLRKDIEARLYSRSKFYVKGGEASHEVDFYLSVRSNYIISSTLSLKGKTLKTAIKHAERILTVGGYLAQSEKVQLD